MLRVKSKGKPKHLETRWWSKDADVAVCYLGFGKRKLFRIREQSRNEEDKKKYCDAKKDAKRVVYVDQKPRKVDSSRDGRELFIIAKQRVVEKKDVVGVSCLKDESGIVKLSVDDQREIWKKHIEKLTNAEDEFFVSNQVKNGVKVKQLAKQPPRLKMLLQNILVEL